MEMPTKTKSILKEWLFIIVSVTLLMYLYYFITWWTLKPYLGDNIYNEYVNSSYARVEILLQGIAFGILFGLINILADNTKLRQKPFGTIIIIKSVLYVIAVTLSQILVYVVFHIFSILPIELLKEMQSQLEIRFIISMSVYFILVIVLINTMIMINRKFGYGELFSMLTGKYHNPRQEKRIFMLLDMKDSTKNAQRLGNSSYSMLIQSCIHDLTDILIRYKASVYQYVGDEIALTWKTPKGVEKMNFINLFFAYEQVLNQKREYYLKRFDIVPEFKAGIEEGIVTVSEVGDIKREIAYHGEVLHTAARLEKMCNNLREKLLITEGVKNLIIENNSYNIKYMGDYHLRGKESEEKVFGINRLEE
jgi:adenylate cyclase